jgi:hypothetical protein
MERSSGPPFTVFATGGFSYPQYGAGNASNTWFACTIVDADGKEVPWVDRDGRVLETVSERYHPAPGQKLALPYRASAYEVQGPVLIPDLPERIAKGEFKLPLYADLPSMPESERKAIRGLMIGNEGKTRIPIYQVYSNAGFDPDKDLLQAPVMPPDQYFFSPWWHSTGARQWRELGLCAGGGVVIDWDLKSSLEGLYAAGQQQYAGADHAASATTGRYAGRKAAQFAKMAREPQIERQQIEEEKLRVYGPIRRKDGIGWKELKAGVCRIMQDYCGEYKSDKVLKLGLWYLESISQNEASEIYARNPHELVRALESLNCIVVAQIVLHHCLARKASSKFLNFKRLDYPVTDPPEWNKLVTLRRENGAVVVEDLPLNYWLLPPNSSSYEENYKRHCGL